MNGYAVEFAYICGEEKEMKKKEFQSRESNLVYETSDIYPLDQNIIFSKLGLVGVCVSSIFCAFENVHICQKKKIVRRPKRRYLQGHCFN